jgi:hypothetical protein
MGKRILGVIGGVIVASMLVGAIEWFGRWIYPFPTGLDPRDPQVMNAYLPEMPIGGLFIVLAAWITGASVGAWIAERVAPSSTVWPGVIVGGIVIGGCIYNFVAIRHPVWFIVLTLVMVPVAAFFGARAGRVSAAEASTIPDAAV